MDWKFFIYKVIFYPIYGYIAALILSLIIIVPLPFPAESVMMAIPLGLIGALVGFILALRREKKKPESNE